MEAWGPTVTRFELGQEVTFNDGAPTALQGLRGRIESTFVDGNLRYYEVVISGCVVADDVPCPSVDYPDGTEPSTDFDCECYRTVHVVGLALSGGTES